MTQPAPKQFFEFADAPPEDTFVIKDRDGSLSYIPKDQFQAAQSEGAQLATEAEYYGAKDAGVGAALTGAARGLTFGFSDPIAVGAMSHFYGKESGEATRRLLNLEKQAHPTISGASELAGMAAPLLLSGGASAGVSAEGMAARAAAEGAAMGIGGQASEDTLADRPFEWQSYAVAGIGGGLLGGLLGYGAGKLATRGGAKVGARAAEEGELYGTKALAEGAPYRAAGAAEEGALRTAEGLGDDVAKKAGFLERQADISAFKGTGATASDLRKLGTSAEAIEERTAQLGRATTEALERQGEKGVVTSKRMAEALTKDANEIGSELGRLHKSLDALETVTERPRFANIAERFESEVVPAIAERFPLTAEEELSKARDFMARLGSQMDDEARGGFMSTWKARQNLDATIKRMGNGEAIGKDAMKDLRSLVKDEIERAGIAASEEAGEEFAGKYASLNQAYRDIVTVRDIATKKASKDAVSPLFSFKDIATGILTGGLTGNPLSLLAPVASKVGREYGDQLTSYVLRKASKIKAFEDAATYVANAFDTGAKRFLERKTSSLPAHVPTSQEVREMKVAVQNPALITSRVEKMLGDMPSISKAGASGVTQTAMRAAAFLRDNLPREEKPVSSGLQPRAPQDMSATALRKAGNMIEAINEPEVLVDRLMQGQLTQEHVNALSAVHPAIYERFQKYVRDNASTLRAKLTLQQEIQLSVLFKEPITELLLPDNVRAFQSVFLPQKPMEKKGVGSNVANINPGAGGTRATQWDKAEKQD